MTYDNDLVKKALVSLVIETTLLEIGKETYDKVVHDLYQKYYCYLPDCYDHPEYLNEILKDLYGNAHNVVVEKINKQLEEFSYHKSISYFVKILNQ
ncbi:MAG: hypothetical protein D4R72_04110 [Nitrosopumilales archaeon]|nr:MAG: hypothetical protein D4R72_04110 [Nitrosopumilales archaeon]